MYHHNLVSCIKPQLKVNCFESGGWPGQSCLTEIQLTSLHGAVWACAMPIGVPTLRLNKEKEQSRGGITAKPQTDHKRELKESSSQEKGEDK